MSEDMRVTLSERLESIPTEAWFAALALEVAVIFFDHPWIAFGAFLVGAILAWLALLRYRSRFGWFYDERGERQLINAVERGQLFFYPTTWTQRVLEEAATRKARRQGLCVLGAYLGIEALSIASLWGHTRDPSALAVMALVLGLVMAPVLLPTLFVLVVQEIAYSLNYQFMKGAKVLDAEPRPPGLEEVMRQKAHGDARLATQDEALALLSRKG